MTLRTPVILAVLVLALPGAALAQIDNPAWGLGAGFSPRWQVPATFGGLVDGDDIDVGGREFRIGIVRGTTRGGEWGLSLVHKRLANDAAVSVDGGEAVARFVNEDAELLGVEVHRFFPFAHVGSRVQIGINLAGGLAQLRGFVRGEFDSASSQSLSAVIATRDIFEYAGRDIDWLPLAKAEVGLTATLGDRAKVRVGGGLNVPGFQIINISVSYLLGHDR
jgi:hypothetical protein